MRRPASAGYSGTPLPQKLGIKAGHRIALVAAPAAFRALIEPLPAAARYAGASARDVDIAIVFATAASVLGPAFAKQAARIVSAGMVWVAWPKRTAAKSTDLSENVVREIGLAAGLVDVKVCAIDATWSGLKFVRRLKDR